MCAQELTARPWLHALCQTAYLSADSSLLTADSWTTLQAEHKMQSSSGADTLTLRLHKVPTLESRVPSGPWTCNLLAWSTVAVRSVRGRAARPKWLRQRTLVCGTWVWHWRGQRRQPAVGQGRA
jgi:hypothetical protein